jgi:hypothetical protein
VSFRIFQPGKLLTACRSSFAVFASSHLPGNGRHAAPVVLEILVKVGVLQFVGALARKELLPAEVAQPLKLIGNVPVQVRGVKLVPVKFVKNLFDFGFQ